MKVMAQEPLRNVDPVFKYYRGKWKELSSGSKVNGEKKLNEFSIKNINDKTIIELEELIIRQEKLLKNKAFLSRLKDKGKNIQERYEELKKALKVAKHKEQNGNNSNPLKDINSIEWGTNPELSNEKSDGETLSSQNLSNDIYEDESEANPLQLLARHSVEYPLKIPEKNIDEDPTSIIQQELEKLEIEDGVQTKNENENTEKKVEPNYFKKKILESGYSERPKGKKLPFYPHRTLRIKEASEMKTETKVSQEEKFKCVQMIPLDVSLKLFAEAQNKEKSKMKVDAFKSLSTLSSTSGDAFSTSTFHNYRDANATHHLLDQFEDEINDYYPKSESEEEDY